MNSANHHIASSSVEETITTVEQLRQENSSLCNTLQTLTRENALLNEVISTVGSTLRLDEVLRHLVDTVLRATCCNSAFMYLYDKEKERLVLASTNERYRHLVGKITLALGEGLVGWVALHNTPVLLTDQAMADPRFQYFPELEEEKFQSTMTVPIIAKDRHLVGVIMLQAVAPHEFTEQDHKFLINTAALVGGAIENAQLYENTQRKLNILTSLSILSQTISSGLYLDDMLRSLATLTVQIMEVDLCVIMLMDQPRERDTESTRQSMRLVVRATSPNLNDRVNFRSIDIDRYALERLREMEMSGDAFESFNPLQDSQYKSLISAPLIAGTEQLGLINCYSNKARRYTSEDQTLLTTIANQAAMAIKNSHLMNQLAQKNLVKGFFDELMQDGADSEDSLRQKAHFLGCDLSRPHAVVMIEISHIDEKRHDLTSTTNRDVRMRPAASHDAGDPAHAQATSLQTIYKRIYSVLRRRVQDSFPGSLFYEHENLLTCLVSLGRDTAGTRLKSWLYELAQQMPKEYGVDLSIGIGNTCQNSSDYRRGFAEANEALHMGQNLHVETKPSPIVTHFNDLGVYRYLYKIAHMDDLRDVYQDQIARIDTYDRRKGTELLPTLETYLECAGNLTKTSERLYVHRNTLIQRLERLQSLCDIDIQERGNWLTLQVAIKVYKLRTTGA
ncbi:MAG: GAF domain-containing protein [Chloroflexi bacterium]|nr:GAF domain-containing protein [Ktedonobacteraceae bacterium]MBV9020302.1 GAF domain-containing protein [Ktedonobacteraceae bacterium]MBV9707885.1 GAF domain-containing protein [Chloroflexota bacterium]